MKTSKLYRQAAELVDDGRAKFCCTALYKVKYRAPMTRKFFRYNVPEALAMCYLFQNETYQNTLYRGTFGSPFERKNQELRVLALCFMAAMAESDERK